MAVMSGIRPIDGPVRRWRGRSRAVVFAALLAGCGGKVGKHVDDAEVGPRCLGVDLSTDARNCGWCGHDCLGATCGNSVCAPTALASNLEGPTEIALDETNVYFASLGAIASLPKAGGAARSAAAGLATVHALALDATSVHFVEGTPARAFRVPKTGGEKASDVPATNPIDTVVCGPDHWGSTGDGGIVYESLLSKLTRSTVADVVARRLACAPDTLVWLDFPLDAAHGRVVRFADFPVKGTVLVADVPFPQRIVTDGKAAYFTSGRTAGLVQSVPLAGGAVTSYASGQLDAEGIAVDEGYVYWVTVGELPEEGTVMRSSKTTRTPEFLAYFQRRPIGLAVDATHVYWTAQGQSGKANGGVYRVPK